MNKKDRVITESNKMIKKFKDLEKTTGLYFHLNISLYALAIIKRNIKLKDL